MFTSASDVTSQTPTISPSRDGCIRGLEEHTASYIVELETVIFLLLWIVALLGNILVVLVIHRSRRVQSTTNFFVVSIAFSDMTLILFSAPFVCIHVIMQEWAAGHVLCRLYKFIQFLSTSSASFVLVAVCIDRFYTIIQPLSFKVTRGTAKRMIIMAWILSALISSMCIYFFEQVVVTNFANIVKKRYVCPTFIPASHWSGMFYAVLCVTSQFFCPLALVIIVYSKIFYHIRSIRQQVRQRRRSNTPVPRTKVKMAKMLMIMSFVTFILYLPYYTAQAVYCFTYRQYLSADVFVFAFWLICASAAVKPVVYAFGNNNFWRGCKEVLCMSTMRCYRMHTYLVTTASSVSKKNYVGALDVSKDQFSISLDSPMDPFNLILNNEMTTYQMNGSLP